MHDIVFSCKSTAMCVFDITLKSIILPRFLHENTNYCISVVPFANLLSQPAEFLHFAKLNCLYFEDEKILQSFLMLSAFLV